VKECQGALPLAKEGSAPFRIRPHARSSLKRTDVRAAAPRIRILPRVVSVPLSGISVAIRAFSAATTCFRVCAMSIAAAMKRISLYQPGIAVPPK
jgi:hypothetical protein